jgi:hypothetical protein
MRRSPLTAGAIAVAVTVSASAFSAAPQGGPLAPAPSASASASASTSASAAPPSPNAQRLARADKRFHDAELLFEQKRYEEACEAFAESQRLDPKLGTMLNIAYCHEAQGKTATAWREYNEAAAWASQQGRADRVAFAQERAAVLAKNVARVDLQLPDDTLLEIDGVAIPHAHFTALVFVDSGVHKVRVSAPGKVAFEMDLAVPQGAWSHTVHVPSLIEEVTKPEPKVAPPPTPSLPPPPPDDTKIILGYTAGGIGAAALVLGTVFAARALDASSTASDHCTRDKCDAAGSASISDARSFSTVSIASMIVGVAGLGGGLYLVLTGNSGSSKSARVAPIAGPQVGGLSLSGAF